MLIVVHVLEGLAAKVLLQFQFAYKTVAAIAIAQLGLMLQILL